MSVRNLATLDRTVFQPLGRILQEAFADGFIGTGTIAITKTFTGTAAYNRAIYMIGEIAAAGALNGMFKFRTYLSGIASSLVQVVCANLHVKDAGVLRYGSGEYNSAFYATIETETSVTPGSALNANLCAYQAAYYFDETNGAPTFAAVLGVPNGTPYQWDGLLLSQSKEALGAHLAEDGSATVTANDIMIPVKIGGSIYYIPALADDDVS